MFSEQQRKERTRMKEKSTIRYAGKERERERRAERKRYIEKSLRVLTELLLLRREMSLLFNLLSEVEEFVLCV